MNLILLRLWAAVFAVAALNALSFGILFVSRLWEAGHIFPMLVAGFIFGISAILLFACAWAEARKPVCMKS